MVRGLRRPGGLTRDPPLDAVACEAEPMLRLIRGREPGGAQTVLKEFKDFVMKGNLIEIAVAFVMALAFAAVVASFVRTS